MKITYFAIALAATISVRVAVAQTPTPSRPRHDTLRQDTSLKKRPTPPFRPPLDTTLRQDTSLKKKPTAPFRPPPNTTLKPTSPPFRPPPDTRLRVTPTPTPVPPFNPFDRNPIATGWKNGAHTFENGVRVEILGDDMVITDARGRRSVTHKHELNHQPPVGVPHICGKLRRWLNAHSANSAKWRESCNWYFDNCR